MRSLLPELCGEVFSYCVFRNNDELDRENIWTICAPVILSNVCRRWRTMVLDNPTLWTQLCIRLDDKINHIARAKLWISRSGQLPIHIILSPSTLPPPTGIPDALLQRFMQAVRWLSGHIHRAKTLAIEPGIPIVPFLLSDGTLPAMPYLTHLILDTDDKDDASIVQCTLDAPLLRYVRLRDLTSMMRIMQRSLGHLRVLVITFSRQWANPTLFGDALSSCSQLVDCTITFPFEAILPPPGPVLLPRVRRLHLHWRFKFDPTAFVRIFQTPNLDHLTLQHNRTGPIVTEFSPGALEELIISAPHLRCLALMHCSLTTQYDISSVLARARNLSRLEMLGCRQSSVLLSSLTPRLQEPPTSWPCPRLHQLSIKPVENQDTQPILEFVRRRMYSGDGAEIAKSGEYSYLEVLELPCSLGMLDFRSRVYMRRELGEIAVSGRVEIVGGIAV